MRTPTLLLALAAASCATSADPAGSWDARVVSVRLPASARAESRTAMTLTLSAASAGPLALTVSATVGTLETVEYVTLPGPGEHVVQVPVRLPGPGDYDVRIRISGTEPDRDPGNDFGTGWIRTKPDRPRVLYVEESPRFEYRFLKAAMVKDATMHVHAYLVSAQSGFPQEHSVSPADPAFGRPLAALPGKLEEYLRYDVIVLGDVGPARFPAGAPAAIAAAVRDHGRGLILIAGPDKVPQAWAATELAALLPVTAAARPAKESGDLRYRLTDDGRRSPVTNLAGDRAASEGLWAQEDAVHFPSVRWAAPVEARPGASVWVKVVSPTAPESPLFVASDAGRGRVFFSATDETWLWRFRVGDSPYFYPFWRRAIDWANGDE